MVQTSRAAPHGYAEYSALPAYELGYAIPTIRVARKIILRLIFKKNITQKILHILKPTLILVLVSCLPQAHFGDDIVSELFVGFNFIAIEF